LVVFVLTEKGERAFQKALGPGWEMVRHVLSGLADEKIQSLTQLLEKMREKAYEYVKSGTNKGEIKKM
jgi:DNA-binding MarR family transcriptional regulator